MLSPLIGSAQSWEEALRLERSGDIEGARELYTSWLDSHSGDAGSGDVLIHTAYLHTDPRDAAALLLRFAGRVPPGEAPAVWAALAALEASIGRPAEAAEHYERASLAGGKQGGQWLLESLVLRYSMGDYQGVYTAAGRVAASAGAGAVRDDASALRALSTAVLSGPEEALDMVEAYINSSGGLFSPGPLLAMRKIAESSGDERRARLALLSLEKDFPLSTAHYLATYRILEWDYPGSLLHWTPPERSGRVQTGAFRSREGAADLRSRLEFDGFTAWIEPDGDIWRVLVNDPDGRIRERLEDAGYEASFGG
jgi:hypothetical protein